MQGIDPLGLDAQDRKYLETIARVFVGGPVGVEAVAHTMNLSPDTLIDEVEPFLLRSELVVRTPRGRRLTPTAFQHLGISPADESDGPDQAHAVPVDRFACRAKRGKRVQCSENASGRYWIRSLAIRDTWPKSSAARSPARPCK